MAELTTTDETTATSCCAPEAAGDLLRADRQGRVLRPEPRRAL